MTTIALKNLETPNERLSASLFLAVVIHVIMLFGVGFDWEQPVNRLNTTLDIILVQTITQAKTEDAEYLAQSSQEGGGNVEDKVRPATPVPSPFPDPSPAVISAAAPPELSAAPRQPMIEELATDQASTEETELRSHETPKEESPETGESDQTVPMIDKVSAATLIMNARNSVASLQTELDMSFNAYSQRARHKSISASTREYRYASYMDSWRVKVERIGNLNYPDQARRQQLSGKLILDVALNADGTIHELKILRPSPYPVLDDAALHIVRMAAPFAPFPKDIRQETDILHITRTWVFSSEDGLSSR